LLGDGVERTGSGDDLPWWPVKGARTSRGWTSQG
jgi:hypothetical protein